MGLRANPSAPQEENVERSLEEELLEVSVTVFPNAGVYHEFNNKWLFYYLKTKMRHSTNTGKMRKI